MQMINLHRSPFIEVIDSKSPAYKEIYEQLTEAKKALPAYIPQLLGVIRKNGAPEFLYHAEAYKGLNGKKYYNIDYYFSFDGADFYHTTTVGFGESAPNKEALLACFDPKQEAARVRFVLNCLKEGLENPAKFWVPRILQEPITDSNKVDFETLLEHVQNDPKQAAFYTSLKKRLTPPPAPLFTHTTAASDPKERARQLVEQGKQLETDDPFKAERCYWHALALDRKNTLAKRNLALLIYSGRTCCDPTLEFTKNLLEESFKASRTNYELNRALGEIYFTGSSTIAPNNDKATKHLKACLKRKPHDNWAIWALEAVKNRKIAAEAARQEAAAVAGIASLFAAKAAETLANGELM